MKLSFTGKRVLISGGTCDLAICLSKYLIESGLWPILTYKSATGLRRISEKLQPFAGRYETVFLDFTDPDSLDPLFSEINNDVDYLVDFAQEDFESLISSANKNNIYRFFFANVSFRAEFLKKISRAMLKKKRGRLVFISSSAAGRPNTGQGFYAAAKSASEALYRNLGLELGSRGITTVSLRPGYIESGRGQKYIRNHEKEVIGSIPIKRVLRIGEMTETILFFLSDSASGFNAVEIAVDGGLTAGK